MKICFAVHAYVPHSKGGSEYYVQWMAEECVKRGHEVSVFTQFPADPLKPVTSYMHNGVRVMKEMISLYSQDLIVVHGSMNSNTYAQDFVLNRSRGLTAPVLYQIILPVETPISLQAIMTVQYIGCSTPEDWAHVKKHNVEQRAHYIRHGISPADCTGTPGQFDREKYGIPRDKKMIVSCGGYWRHKRMHELSEIFKSADLKDTVLVTAGYWSGSGNTFARQVPEPDEHNRVIALYLPKPQEVKDLIADADLYVMHSEQEGFGLTVLEAMLNRTPWIGNNIAGAKLLKEFGHTYETDEGLFNLLKTHDTLEDKTAAAYNYVMDHHLISHTVDDILKLVNK